MSDLVKREDSQLQVIDSRIVFGKKLTIYGTIEKPLFLAKDVAEWIEHSDVSTMLRTVDDAEKLTHTIYASGQNREMWFLTEDGLYEVLMQSRKPIAKQFKDRVKAILRDIRMSNYKMVAGEDGWDDQRKFSKERFHLLDYVIDLTGKRDSLEEAELRTRKSLEFGRLNKLVFGLPNKEWKETNPELKGNQRDHASKEELDFMSTLQSADAMLILAGLPAEKRFQMLGQLSIMMKTIKHKWREAIVFDRPRVSDIHDFVRDYSAMYMEEIHWLYLQGKETSDTDRLNGNSLDELLRYQVAHQIRVSLGCDIDHEFSYKTKKHNPKADELLSKMKIPKLNPITDQIVMVDFPKEHIWDLCIHRKKTDDILIDIDWSFHLETSGIITRDGFSLAEYFHNIRELRKYQTDGLPAFIVLTPEDNVGLQTPVMSVDGKQLTVLKNLNDILSGRATPENFRLEKK
jgi:prophage antirepressor-like protein